MVVVVADPRLEAGGRPGGLNAPDETLGDEQAQGIVNGLERDGPDLGPDGIGDLVGRDVGLPRNGPQNGQPLGGDLNAVLPKEIAGVGRHQGSIDQILE
jgi:hypothetical protein